MARQISANDLAKGALGIAALYIATKVVQRFSEPEHKTLLRDTYETVRRNVGNEATVLVDHISPQGADGNPRRLDLEMYPDIVVKGGPGTSNLFIEVEDENSLDRHAATQLDEFRRPGYKRVLVVPSGIAQEARKFVSDLDGKVTVATPTDVAQHL